MSQCDQLGKKQEEVYVQAWSAFEGRGGSEQKALPKEVEISVMRNDVAKTECFNTQEVICKCLNGGFVYT